MTGRIDGADDNQLMKRLIFFVATYMSTLFVM